MDGDERPRYGFSEPRLRQEPTSFAPNLFRDRVVVVSGAGSGFGKAIASLFARLGASVAINGRDADKLTASETFLRSLGGEVFSRAHTIRDADAVEAFIEDVHRAFGRIDVLVNNAGGQFAQPAIDISRKGWLAVVDTNLNGTWWMTQAVARRWIAQQRPGNIVNIVASVTRGLPGMAHSAAARAGVVAMSKTVAVEWAPYGIRINCVAPGCCESTGFNNYTREGAATFAESNPLRRTGDEWDIAEAVVYLAGPSGKFITGETLAVDGGQQLWGDPWPTGRPAHFAL